MAADWVKKYKRKLSPKLKVSVDINGGFGRYTGNGGKSEPVGVVHGQEYVVSQPIVQALGGPANVEKVLAQNLQAQGAPGFQIGGAVTQNTSNGTLGRGLTSSGQGAYEAKRQKLPTLTSDNWRTGDNGQPTQVGKDWIRSLRQGVNFARRPGESVPRNEMRWNTNRFGQNTTKPPTGFANDPSGRTAYETKPPTGFENDPSGRTAYETKPPTGFENDPSGRTAYETKPPTGFENDPSGRTAYETKPPIEYNYPIYMDEGLGAGSGTIGLETPDAETRDKIRELQGGVDFGGETTTEDDTVTTEDDTVTTEDDIVTTGAGNRAYEAGLGGLAAYAAGEDPATRRIYNAIMGYQRASDAQERAAYQQELAQMGMSPGAAAAYMNLMGRQQASQEAQLAGQLATDAAGRAYGATQQMAGLGLSGRGQDIQQQQFGENLTERQRQFDENMSFMREKYGDQEGQRMARDAASGMSWESFSEKYPNATQKDWQRMQTMFEQGAEMGDIAIAGARVNLSAAESSDIFDKINQGWSVDEINTAREEQGRDEITPEQYWALKWNTPSGIREYRRNMEMANEAARDGNWDKMNDMFAMNGYGTSENPFIDTSKLESREYYGALSKIQGIMSTFDENTPEDVIANWTNLAGVMLNKALGAEGWEVNYDENDNVTSVTAPDGTVTEFDEVIGSLDDPGALDPPNPDDPDPELTKAQKVIAELGVPIAEWWNNQSYDEGGSGSYQSRLAISPEYQTLMEKVQAGDEAASEELGQLVTTLHYASLAGNETNASPEQLEILDKYGVVPSGWQVDKPTYASVNEKYIDGIKKAINQGNLAGAEKTWDNMTEAEREASTYNSFQDLSDAVFLEKIAPPESAETKINSFASLSEPDRKRFLDLLKSGNTRALALTKSIPTLSNKLNIVEHKGAPERYKLSSEGLNLTKNVGDVVKIGDRWWVVDSVHNAYEEDTSGYVTLMDLESGVTWKYTGHAISDDEQSKGNDAEERIKIWVNAHRVIPNTDVIKDALTMSWTDFEDKYQNTPDMIQKPQYGEIRGAFRGSILDFSAT